MFSNSLRTLASLAIVTTVAFSMLIENAAAGDSTYRGYHVDLSKLAGFPNGQAIANGIQRQLDIVESVGLPPRVLEFLHTIPIIGDAGPCSETHTPACYNGSAVIVHPVVLDRRPIVLHELLHAYHHKMLPRSFQNPDVLRFYNHAKTAQLYPAGEYLLTNQKEFFAVTASVFLYGEIAREPYTSSNLKAKQPIYVQYLERLFGPHPTVSASLVGSLPQAPAPQNRGAPLDPARPPQTGPNTLPAPPTPPISGQQPCWRPGSGRNIGIAELSCDAFGTPRDNR